MILEFIIFFLNIIFQFFKYNKNNKIKTIINRIIYFAITKYKFDKKLNELQKYI